VSNASGKLVIIGILTVAVAAAGASWWFRYSATNRAATYWGPNAARLIRDAPIVEFYQFKSSGQSQFEFDELIQFLDAPTNRRDISSMQGLTHLRNALLEDRSYNWPPEPRERIDQWRWVLVFRDKSRYPTAALAFSPDWRFVTHCQHPFGKNLSTEPISTGLNKMFAEFLSKSSAPVR